MTIAVTGATGQLGRIVVEKLKQKVPAADIIGLVRSPEKAKDLGVAVRAADYTQPVALQAALSGVDTLLLISSSEIGQRTTQHANVVEAAKRAGVRRIVYTSLLHADTSPLSLLAGEHRQSEAAIKASGLPYTILRNGWYTENHTGSIPGVLAGGALFGSAGDGRVSAATREDYAEAAVAVLTSQGHEGKTYELAGDDAWTLSDFVAEISRQTGRYIPYKNLLKADYAAVLQKSGLPGAVVELIASSDVGTSQGALFHEGRELSQLIGRPTTPLRAAVTAVLKD